MPSLLDMIQSPRDLRTWSHQDLRRLAAEIRAELCQLLEVRSAHFASNLGVVELTLALHSVFDFSRDRLIWDTGHQIYPHKLITGRHRQFHTIRTKGGLMGFPNPQESPYDLFVTGHAGCSVSCALGLKTGDELLGEGERRSVAVIGDGALPSGIVFEALNNAGGMQKDLLVILNDNRMSICSRVGALAQYLDKARGAVGSHQDWGACADVLSAGDGAGRWFEELGFHYAGPVDGHDLQALTESLHSARLQRGPVLLHVLTEKGHGFGPAVEDPVKYHAPAPFRWDGALPHALKAKGTKPLTEVAAQSIYQAMQADERVTVITAAMCQGNNLERVRTDMPARFFDTGITESHAVAFAAGLAKSGGRPIVAIYSTFLQRAYDQLFQEVSLQNLPVIFCLDRAGLTGPDGPTHHGVFDTAYLRPFPNLTVMSPGDASDLPLMLDFAVQHSGPVSMRYPKCAAEEVSRAVAPVRLGEAETLRTGRDVTLIAYGSLLSECVRAAEQLSREGLDVGVINARFVKPLDTRTILAAVTRSRFVLTVEEGTLAGGFGEAVVAAANEAGVETGHVRRLGIPDRFIEHGERAELLADLGLDADGIYLKVLEGIPCRPLVPETNSQASTGWSNPLEALPINALSSF